MAEVKGPAAYFPAIEAKYGKPVEEWKSVVRAAAAARPDATHGELVGLLTSEHGTGHGHAHAVVAHTLAEDRG